MAGGDAHSRLRAAPRRGLRREAPRHCAGGNGGWTPMTKAERRWRWQRMADGGSGEQSRDSAAARTEHKYLIHALRLSAPASATASCKRV
jgi:hypothetical protein